MKIEVNLTKKFDRCKILCYHYANFEKSRNIIFILGEKIMAEKIAVLGAGSWGSVLANMLTENGHDVTLWSRNEEQVKQLNTEHTNPRYMKDFV